MVGRFVGVGVLVVFLAGVAHADEVVLNNGRAISGQVIKVTKSEVVLEVDGQKLRLPRNLVKEIRRSKDKQEPGPKAKGKARPVRLAWSFKPGRTLRYQATSKRKIAIPRDAIPEGMEDPGTEDHTSTIDFRLKGLATGVNGFQVELTIERIRERGTKKGVETRTDTSSKRASERPKDMFLIDTPIVIDLSPQGELLEIHSIGGSKLSTWPAQSQRDTEHMIGEYLLRLSLFGLMGTFPKGDVAPDTRWSEDVTVNTPNFGRLVIEAENRFRDVADGVARITQTGGLRIRGVKKSVLKRTKLRGTVEFSTTEGHLLEVRQRTTGRFQEAKGAPIPIDVTLELVVELQK